MIALRRARERLHERSRKREAWLTFARDPAGERVGEGLETSFENLSESRLRPGSVGPDRPRRELEILTYVREGGIAYEDSAGCAGVVCTGEFQCTRPGIGIRYREVNVSRSRHAHVFQIWFRSPEARADALYEQKRFSVADRRGDLCLVASANARSGSLRLDDDSSVYSAILETGRHVVHELTKGRKAWLHLVEGSVMLGDLVLNTGDGAGISHERTVSLTAQSGAEILLLDLEDPLSPSP